jgi:hypothetical protein
MAPAMTQAATITLSDGDNLQTAIDAANGGDTLVLNTGVYSQISFSGRHFTEAQPLIIKAAPGATPIVRGSSYQQGYLARISSSSYVVLDGLTFEKCNQPLYLTDIDHFILINLDVRDTGQEMVHVRGTSRYVDIINCKIHDSGHTNPQWAEGIYIGSGSAPMMNEEYIWIEGNEIYNTGNSEAVNVKSQSYHITVRGNKIHDIPPGTDTQYNEAAISMESADLTFKPGVDPDIWIEDNEIYNIRYGRWANGIKMSTMGGRVINNEIHDCEQNGINFNSYGQGDVVFTTWLYGNSFANCAAGDIGSTSMPVVNGHPGANPNRPQTWYKSSERVAGPQPKTAGSIYALSTRAYVGTGSDVLIGGFIIGGTGAKRLLIRGVGPTLSSRGVSNPLPNPMLELVALSGKLIARNDNWWDNTNDATAIDQASLSIGSQLPANSLDAAMIVTLPPGLYTAIVRGISSGTGVGLVEIYDLDTDAASKLTAISSRGRIGTGGEPMIAGFITEGASRSLLVQAVGPSLVGVPGAIADPLVTLRRYPEASIVLENDDWYLDSANRAAVIAAHALGGSPLGVTTNNVVDLNTKDSAFVVSQTGGAFTAVATAKGSASGVVLTEIYDVTP